MCSARHKNAFGDVCSQFGNTHMLCFHPLVLNHISKVLTGPCAAYTAETKQRRGRGAGLQSCLSPTGASVRAILLFSGNMIDRRMRDGKETALVSFHHITLSLFRSFGEGLVL